MNYKDRQKKPLPKTDAAKKDESKEAIGRGKAAIKARMDIDQRPAEIKNKEEAEDAEKWRNEG